MNQSQHRREKANQKRKKRTPRNLHCVVHFLDQTALLFRCNASLSYSFRFSAHSSNSKPFVFVQGKDEGKCLMEQVIQRFGLREPHYFGLLYSVEHSAYCWLEEDKSLSHQLKGKTS